MESSNTAFNEKVLPSPPRTANPEVTTQLTSPFENLPTAEAFGMCTVDGECS